MHASLTPDLITDCADKVKHPHGSRFPASLRPLGIQFLRDRRVFELSDPFGQQLLPEVPDADSPTPVTQLSSRASQLWDYFKLPVRLF